jgi:hypothetical protein
VIAQERERISGMDAMTANLKTAQRGTSLSTRTPLHRVLSVSTNPLEALPVCVTRKEMRARCQRPVALKTQPLDSLLLETIRARRALNARVVATDPRTRMLTVKQRR